MKAKFSYKAAVYTAVITITILLVACGQGSKRVPTLSTIGTQQVAEPVAMEQQVTWPGTLPEDKAQPWEELDADGRVIPPKAASNLNFDSIFAAGIERYLEAGDVTDFGEASSFASGAAGEELVSYAIYRLPLGVDQPGTITADVNVHNGSAYYIGVGDYSVNSWHWYGPFAVTHVRFNVPDAEYTSVIANLMLAVVAYDGASFDVVALGTNVRDAADIEAPAIPAAPTLTQVAGGVFAEWLVVAADDLAGYRIYADGMEVLDYLEGGTSFVVPATSEVEVTLTAVDISGNESELSDPATETPLAGDMPLVELSATAASGVRNDVIELAATGAETYDWDIDGDGTWDFTDDPTDNRDADTGNLGVIRPAIRAHTSEGGFSLSAVSLFITGNFRPVVIATADVTYGMAPLDVEFTLVAEDDDGTIDEYAWDFDGDGTFEGNQVDNPSPLPNTYSAPGMYNAKFRVTDDDGAWAVDTVAVQVLADPDNAMPIIDEVSASPSLCTPGTLVTFTATATDSDGTIASYEWDFDNDGVADDTGDTVSYTFASEGYYNVKLKVTDDLGGYAVGYVGVHVQDEVPNMPPVAILTADETVFYLGETGDASMSFDASASYDPDGTSLTYYFDPEGDGSYVNNGADATYDHIYSDNGVYLASLKAEDIDNNCDYNSILITVYRFGTQTPDAAGNVGKYTSLAVVNGNPAISYWNEANSDLKYVRASDSSGSSWGSPVTVDATGSVGHTCSLAVVSGFPAISYWDFSNNDLDYVRASDASGSSWCSPVTVDSSVAVGSFASLAVVSGFPAISYYDGDNGDLKYVRATDASGISWGSPVAVDSTGAVGQDTCLAIVNGNPAISYRDVTNNDLKYVRADDINGSTWGTPVTLDSAGIVGYYTSLKVVNGYPAISYFDDTNDDLKYVRASDANGLAWGTPVIVDSTGWVGEYTCLAIVNGNPAISYYNETTDNLNYVRASDADGSSWESPVAVYSPGDVGGYTSLAIINGRPAISYYDFTNQDLKFAYPRLD